MIDGILAELADKRGRVRMHHLVTRLLDVFEEDGQLADELLEETMPDSSANPREQVDQLVVRILASYFVEDDETVELLFRRVTEMLESLGEEDEASMLHELIGIRYVDYQQPQRALHHLTYCRKLYERQGDELRLARALNNTGMAYKDMGNFKEALSLYKQSVALNTKINNEDLINSYNNLASVYLRLGMYDVAFQTYEKALEACQTFGDHPTRPYIFSNIASINAELESYPEALKYNHLALEELGDSFFEKRLRANILNNIGFVYEKTGQIEKAFDSFNTAIAISRELGLPRLTAQCLMNTGNAHLHTGQFEKALDALRQSRSIFNSVGDTYHLTFANMSLAEAFIETRDYAQAKKALDAASNLQQRGDFQECLFNLHRLYIMLYQALADFPQLIARQADMLALYEKEIDEEYPGKLAQMQAVFDLEQKEKEAEIHRLKTIELQKKNDEIMQQKRRLEETLEELRRSEIGFAYLNREIKDILGSTIIGESEQIRNIHNLIHMVATTPDTSVLITGETGTGKELVARAIHDLSDRKRKNFCAVNISSIPDTLFESEFFGYRKNAFTGAERDKSGWFEIASGGTLFLDEIGTWQLSMQSKFLRVLENRVIIPVGADCEIPIDIRLISATNDELQTMLELKHFRADLYYRLSSFVIHIPPLRERTGDIPLLVEYFVKHFNQIMKKKVTRIQKQVETLLCAYNFPGNVRELKNMVERAMIMCRGNTLKPDHFVVPGQIKDENVVTLEEHEKRLVKEALERTGYHQANAARLLGITPKSMERRVRKFNLMPKK